MADESADLEKTFTITVLDDFVERTNSDCSIILEPLGDDMGWRVQVVPCGTDLVLGRASHKSLFDALDKAISRALENLESALQDDDEDD